MICYLNNYIDKLDNELNNKKEINYNKIEKEYLFKIKLFQYERFINIMVIMFYTLFSILFAYISIFFPLYLIISILLLVFLIFYVVHYFKLEKGIQLLYCKYDSIMNGVK